MMNKMFAFIVLAFLAVPFVALAQSSISLETLSVVDIPADSIVVLSQEETGLKDVLQFERTMCARQKMNDYDTSSD